MYRVNRKFLQDDTSTFNVLEMCRLERIEEEIRGLTLEDARRYADFEATPVHKVAVEEKVPSEMLLKYVTDSDLAKALEIHISERGTTVECHTLVRLEDSFKNGLAFFAVFRKHFEIPFSNLDSSHHVITASVTYHVRIVYGA